MNVCNPSWPQAHKENEMDRIIHGGGQAILNGCGKLHFTYGPVTVHFDQEES